MSRYLKQVRDALMKDFVQKNIGSKTKNRENWLKHNSDMSKRIFESKEDELILVADGTYCYCQKSSNNSFQRKSYSVQKSRHLVKPFVICSTDGYIVDIYGLFEASKNDAKILSTILKEDKDLTLLLKDNDIFVLDRGFRDCVKELEDEYNLQVKMPALLGKEKQLNTEAANLSRFVTKIRWVIEVINSFLKNSFKALKQVANKSLPHTHDDYKIAGALVNKYFKRLFSDKDDNLAIVENMKKKLNTKNELKSIVDEDKLHLKSKFVTLSTSLIKDFPKLDENIIKSNITLGTYQLKQAHGYLCENFSKGKLEIRANKENLNYKSSKIMFALIKSRHANKIKYKVYCKYQPAFDSIDAIESWYCTCKAGMRTVGCCSHIASIIYYFAHGIYLNSIPNPGEHLLTIFPVPELYCEDEDTDNDVEIITPKSTFKSKKINIENSSENESFSIANETDSSSEILNESIKRLISTDNIAETAKKKKNGTQIDVDMSSKSEKISNAINIVMFKERLPIWGGNFINNFGMNSHVKISNTCTIDNFLLALWTCTKLNNNIVSYISNMKFHSGHFLNEIITCIENKEWNKAKSIWLLDVLSLDYELECNCDHCKNCLTNGAISTFGSEYEFFLQPIVEIQKYEVIMSCSITCKNNNIKKESVSLNFQKINDEVSLIFTNQKECCYCLNKIKSECSFFYNPPWIFIQTSNSKAIYANELPKFLILMKKRYELLCATIHTKSPGHFRSIFYLNSIFFLIDDLNPKMETKQPKQKIVTCFYFVS